MSALRVGFLGPLGTFTHEATLSQDDLAKSFLVPLSSIADVLHAVATGEVHRGVVPLENSIEGTVSATIDSLIFGQDLLIEREIVMPITLSLVAPTGLTLAEATEVWSYPHALAQCRTFITSLGGVTEKVAASTADAARQVAEMKSTAVAVAPALAADLYGLSVLASGIEDHVGNETKFVVVGRNEIPGASGRDRTTIVCFQDADRPGSLYEILGRFAARNINLTRLESRPTKKGLGDYCFVIEFQGHILDDVVGSCLADLQAHLARVKFLGSYPVTGNVSDPPNPSVATAQTEATLWVQNLRAKVRDSS